MAGNSNGKLRILFIMQILQDETDDEHGLSMSDIISRLSELGISADRKTIYTDLDALREFGMSIGTVQRSPVEYYLERREFSLDELMLMVDAVQSCPFITQSQADRLGRNIRRLATDSQREKLERRIHVDSRVRGHNDAMLSSVDKIHDAMHARKKVSFTYWKIGLDGKAHAEYDGERYVVSPMRISFSDSRYYLTAWSDKHNEVREYRVDRMQGLRQLDEKAVRNDLMTDYEYHVRDSQYFGHFDGPVTNVTLRVERDLMPAVIDRFGKDAVVKARDDGAADVRASVRVSPQFFGWVSGMDGFVTIVKPSELAEEYRDYLRKLLGE